MAGSEDYYAHAEECVRLAALTKDDFVKRELLSLRQSFIRTAEHLRQQEKDPKK